MSTLDPAEIRNGHLVYPMPLDARIGTFDHFDFFPDLFLRSDLFRTVIEDGRAGESVALAVALWSHSFREAPVGTIPSDVDAQAHMIGLGAAKKRWRGVAPDAARGFMPVMQPDGTVIEGRLSHPVMLPVCIAAWGRHVANVRKRENDRLNAARGQVRLGLREARMAADAKAPVETIDRCLAYCDVAGLPKKSGAVEAYTAVIGGWMPEASVVVPMRARR